MSTSPQLLLKQNNNEALVVVDPDDIRLEQVNDEMAAVELSPKRRRGHGQTVVFPKGPPPPLHIVDDDLPVCDSSGRQMMSDDLKTTMKAASKKAVLDKQFGSGGRNGKRENLLDQEEEEPLQEEVINENEHQIAAHHESENFIEQQQMANKQTIITTTKTPASTLLLSQRQSAGVKSESNNKFFEVFPKLNEQAIDLLGRCSEPETALDMLRQALSELNTEKGIKEGMPHYRHKLMVSSQDQIQQKTAALQSKASNTVVNSSCLPPSCPNNHSKASLLKVNAHNKHNHHHFSPNKPNAKSNNTIGTQSGTATVQVSCFLDKKPTAIGAGGKQKRDQTMTKCGGFSSNSTCERSTANFISSLKSSLITTPATSPGLTLGGQQQNASQQPPLTQKELKDRTKESNLIVCLYYNLACCYQRLGLLEESVEYLELASDQLEDTVQFFEAQEDSIIKSRQQLRNQQKQQYTQQQTNYQKLAQTHTTSTSSQKAQPQKRKNSQKGSSSGGLLAAGHTSNDVNSKTNTLLLHQKSSSIQLEQNAGTQYKSKGGTQQKSKRQLSNESNNSASGARKELKRADKISIKDCEQQLLAGSSAEHLNNLLRQTFKDSNADEDNVIVTETSKNQNNLLQRMSKGASKLLQTKEQADSLLQVSGSHLINLHNSAEQLVTHQKSSNNKNKTTTTTGKGSMLPQTIKAANQLQFASFTNNYSSIIDKNSSSGRNVSPVTTTSLPPEQSTVFSFHNNPAGTITVEQLLAEKMHKSRYQCKMNLQICALQSQLGKHQDALIYGRRAAQICYKLIKSAQMLCKRYVLQIQRHIQARQAKAASANYNSVSQNENTSLYQGAGFAITTLPDQNTSGESPPSHQLNNLAANSTTSVLHNNFHPSVAKGPSRHHKAFTEINDSFEDDYQAAQFYHRKHDKAAKTRIETGSNSSNYSQSNRHAVKYHGGGKKSMIAGIISGSVLKRPRSSCSSNGGAPRSQNSRSSQNTTSQQGLTRLRLSRRSTAKLGKVDCGGSRSSCGGASSGRESSTESLDKIHTFNLKNSNSIAGRRLSDGSVSTSQINQSEAALKSSSCEGGVGAAASVYQNMVCGPTSNETSNTNNALVASSLGGMLMVDGVSIMAANSSQQQPQTMPKSGVLLEESKSVLKAYADDANIQQMKMSMADTRSLARNVYIEESVKVLESLIIQADPLLQELASIVKEFEDKSQKSAIDRDQDMIKKYGQTDFKDRRKRLKISFTTLKELVNIEKDQRFKLNVRNTLGVKNSQDWIFNLNIGNVMHLNMMKDQELNANIENTHELTKDTMLEKVVLITSAYFCIATEIRFILQKDLLDVKLITKKDSESYHAKALHIALLFLPEDCPLSQYINQTYCKNYLQPKLKLQKQRNAYISQKMAKQHQSRQKQLQLNLADKEKSHTLKKALAEASSQSTQSKRPSTSLLKEMIGSSSKFLISTKSYEGLTNHAQFTANQPEPNYNTGNLTSNTNFAANLESLNAPEATMNSTNIGPQTSQTPAQIQHQFSNTIVRKQGATPDLSVNKKSQAAQLSSQGPNGGTIKQHHAKNTCLLVGSEQKLLQPNKTTKNLPQTASQKSIKQTSQLVNKYQTSGVSSGQQPTSSQKQNALHRGHYPSTGGFQPVLQSLHRQTAGAATTASGAVVQSSSGSTRHHHNRVKSPPQAQIGKSGKKNLHLHQHNYNSSTIGNVCNTGTVTNQQQQYVNNYSNSTKEGVSGGNNRIVRESSCSVRKIKIDLGVICNQPSSQQKTANMQHSQHQNQRSGSRRGLSNIKKQQPQLQQQTSSSAISSPSVGRGNHAITAKAPRKISSGGNHHSQKTKLQHQQVKQHMGDCSSSGVGLTSGTINQAGAPSTQQTTSIGRKQQNTHHINRQQAASSSSLANQQQQQQLRQNQMAVMQEKQAIMLAALKLLKMKQQQPSNNKQQLQKDHK